MGNPTTDEYRWSARPVLAALLTGALWVTPVLCAVGAAVALSRLWVSPETTMATVYRWIVILGVAAVVFLGFESLTRRLLPLTVLLKLPMAFPGRAPRRLALARQSWAADGFRRKIDATWFLTVSDKPMVAAEQLLVLVAVLGARDGTTRRHAGQVRALTDLMAERLRLSGHDQDRLRWSALAHDAVQLQTHVGGLSRPGMAAEAGGGAEGGPALSATTLTAPLAPWLGPSYDIGAENQPPVNATESGPGLPDHDVWLGGRIVAVADFYDSATRRHGSRLAMPTKAARLLLAADPDARFDPVVVRAFLAVPAGPGPDRFRLASLATSLVGSVGPRLARMGDSFGRVGIGAVVVATSVVALATSPSVVVSASRTHVPGTSRQGRYPVPQGVRRPTFAAGGGQRPGGSVGAGTSTTTGVNHPLGTGSQVGQGVTRETRTSTTGAGHPGGKPATQGDTGSAGPSTTVASGSGTSIPVTTVGGPTPTGPSTTSAAPPPPPPPPLLPPSGLSGASDCQVVVILPEVSLSWTASPSGNVTGYVILRGSSVSALTYLATVDGGTATTYTDNSVLGLATTYWYEVEAVGGGSSAATSPISVTTPSFCVSAGTPQ